MISSPHLFHVWEGNARLSYKGMILHWYEMPMANPLGGRTQHQPVLDPESLDRQHWCCTVPLQVYSLLGSLSQCWWSLTIWAHLKTCQSPPYFFFFTARWNTYYSQSHGHDYILKAAHYGLGQCSLLCASYWSDLHLLCSLLFFHVENHHVKRSFSNWYSTSWITPAVSLAYE